MARRRPDAGAGRPAYPRRHLQAAGAFSVLFLIALILLPDRDHRAHAEASIEVAATPAASPPEAPIVADAAAPTAPAPEATAETVAAASPWQQVTVRSGDSLARIFDRQGLPARDLAAVLESDEAAERLKRIHPGELLEYRTDDDGRLLALRYAFSRLESMTAQRPEATAGFETRQVLREPERRSVLREAEIDSSLFLAAARIGLDDRLAMEVANIFQWDVDFVLDIRKGDRFQLLYEELWLDGERIGHGDVLAAEFVNQGDRYQAVRFVDEDGHGSYYTPDGDSMRKAFLRAPVQFTRVSSNFNLSRKHPLWNTARPHRGIDYAAPTGTPIVAAGDGKVVTVTSNAASGKFVVIQHGEQYQTKYLHMSRFARGIRAGKRVHQGEVIGYVGSTGWATGPHLHYEFLVSGVHRNPRTVPLPKALPIPEQERERFLATTRTLLAQLNTASGDEQLALSGPGTPRNGG
ncbi:MAG: peptidoglycan DD-metalloendopeptidase family protein [Pseudomonadales bacterium]|nr:peptidoglycan DD-metalloendopeptidase family protein [Pseudomonadales bacterium]